jgi:hypothetical protein
MLPEINHSILAGFFYHAFFFLISLSCFLARLCFLFFFISPRKLITPFVLNQQYDITIPIGGNQSLHVTILSDLVPLLILRNC